ncbi:MAG TPA: hypothetical protein PKY30_01190, partial [Myxococcota bacterium]|nr:hypothetical protein [Myxococcota bacterium]
MRMEPWEQIRQALIDCSPEKEISEEQPDTRRLPFYFPTSRFRAALQHDNYLILGDRGAGKTMLFRVLDENAADIFGNSDVQGETRVGFARRRRGAPMPQAEDLSKQLAGAEVPRLRLFWLGLLGHSVLKELHGLPKELVEALQHPHDVGGWLPLVEHHSTVLSNALDALDTELATEGRWRFFLYDDLDLLMPTWPELFAPLRGLFGLWQSRTRTWRRLRPKIFLRQDIFQSSLLAFPDGAKFFAAHQVELSWSPAQLFALLLKRLLNLGEGRPHSRPDNPENDPAFQRWLQQHTEGVSIVRKLSIGQVPTPTEQFGPRLMAALA